MLLFSLLHHLVFYDFSISDRDDSVRLQCYFFVMCDKKNRLLIFLIGELQNIQDLSAADLLTFVLADVFPFSQDSAYPQSHIDFGFTESKIFKNIFTMYYPSTHNTGIAFLSFSSYLFPLYPRTLNPLFHQLFQIRIFSYPLLFPD